MSDHDPGQRRYLDRSGSQPTVDSKKLNVSENVPVVDRDSVRRGLLRGQRTESASEEERLQAPDVVHASAGQGMAARQDDPCVDAPPIRRSSIFGAFASAISNVVGRTWSIIRDIVGVVVGTISDIIRPTPLAPILDFGRWALDSVVNGGQRMYDSAKSGGLWMINSVRGGAHRSFNFCRNSLSALAGQSKSAVGRKTTVLYVASHDPDAISSYTASGSLRRSGIPSLDVARSDSGFEKLKEGKTYNSVSPLIAQAATAYAAAAQQEKERQADDKKAHEQARQEKVNQTREIIKQIDMHNGADPDNPRVRDILSSLNDPVTNLDAAISQVKDLQASERKDQN